MNTLELKGGMHEMIAKVNDEELLRQLHKIITEVITQNLERTDFWEELSLDQRKEFDIALEESFDKNNLISHEEVSISFQRWLNK